MTLIPAIAYYGIAAKVDNGFYTPFFDRLESRNQDIKTHVAA
jgi:hypothetical protein